MPPYARIPAHFRKEHRIIGSTKGATMHDEAGARSMCGPSWLRRVLAVHCVAGVMALAGLDALALEMLEPPKGSIVRPGTALKIKLSSQAELPVAKVTYSMLEEDRAFEDKVEEPPSVSTDAPPFEAALAIPPDAIGAYRLLAVAEIKERRGFYILFAETTVRVEPEAALTALRAESPVRFTKTVGEVEVLSVQGLYADRVVRDLTHGNTGTMYRVSDQSIVRVNADGRVQALKEGRTEITATNQGKDVTIRAVVEVRNPENRPPVADAGPDQTVKQGARVRLDAIRSADPEGENPFYYWSQVQGMPVNLLEPLSLRPHFIAPGVDSPRVLRFRLIVKDKEEAESFPAYVNVTVVP